VAECIDLGCNFLSAGDRDRLIVICTEISGVPLPA
jgi:hypothetical protein